MAKQTFLYVRTDKDTAFTDSLIQYASEYEDIVVTAFGPLKCKVESIRLLSQQNLAWLVAFHRTDNTTPGADSITDFDVNTMTEFWSWTAGDGFALGTAYLYSVSGLAIPYIDEDNTGELHVSLHNRSSTSKTATSGGVGHVQMLFGLSTEV